MIEEDLLVFSNSMVDSSATFPVKLFALMIYECGEVIDWLPHGLAFRINDVNAFARDIIPRYFKQSKLTSFQRQLNLYGFRRLTKGEDQGAYFHPNFQRNRKDKLLLIKRLPGKGSTPPVDYSGYEEFLTPRFNGNSTNQISEISQAKTYNLRNNESSKLNKQYEDYSINDSSKSISGRKSRNNNTPSHYQTNNSYNTTKEMTHNNKRGLDESESSNRYSNNQISNLSRNSTNQNDLNQHGYNSSFPKSKSKITMNIGYEHIVQMPNIVTYPPIQSNYMNNNNNNKPQLKNSTSLASLDSFISSKSELEALALPFDSLTYDEYNRRRFGVAKSVIESEIELDQIDLDSMFNGLPSVV